MTESPPQAAARAAPPRPADPTARARPPGPEQAQRQDAANKPPSPTRFRPNRWWLAILALALLNYALAAILVPDQNQRFEVPYTFFKQQVLAGNVAEVMTQGDLIQGTFKQPVTY